MPINSPKKDDYSQLLSEISKLTLTGSGGTGFRYAQSAAIALPPNEESIILGSSSNVLREIYLINNSSEAIVDLFWSDGISVTAIPESLNPNGGIFQDWSDGGLELRAKSSIEAQLKIWVRSVKPIDYQIGLEEMVPVKIVLYAPTNRDYLEGDSDPGNFGYNLNRLFGSNNGVVGHKLFAISQSTPGKEVSFTIDTTLQTPIAFQWLDPFELALQGFKIASDILNPENEELPSDFAGRLTRDAVWASSITDASQPIKLKPNRCEFMGRFVDNNPNTGYFDTAVITGYTPNTSNTFDGGTITLGGF